MSLEAMNWARKSLKRMPDEIRTGPRMVLLLLADYADERHLSWPSLGTLAGEVGCSVRSVQRAIDMLEVHGLVSVQSRHDHNGRQRSNGYRLSVEGGCQFVTPTMSAQSGEGVSVTPSEGDSLTTRGDTGVRGRVSPVSPLESTTRTYPLSHSASAEIDSEPEWLTTARSENAAAAAQPIDPTSNAGRVPMTLDWEPDAWQLTAMLKRRGVPAETRAEPFTAGELDDFRNHFADKPGQVRSPGAWLNRFAAWVAENRKREHHQGAALPSSGDRHADRTAAHPNRNERDRVRDSLANPADTSWADGLWPDDE